MHSELSEYNVFCPYCGEQIEVLVEHQLGSNEYIEDCQVCCRPIVFRVVESIDGETSVYVNTENDTF